MNKQFDDTDIDRSLEKLDADLTWSENQRQSVKSKIITELGRTGFQEKRKRPIKSVRFANSTFPGKVIYSCIAMILLFGLFVGSAFVLPAMAEVVSKIPYLGKLIKTEPIVTVIHDELREKDYQIAGVGASYQGKKEISVRIQGTDNYYQSVKDEVETIAKDMLASRNYDAYAVKVSKYEENEPDISDADKERMEANFKLSETIQQTMEKHGYDNLSLGGIFSFNESDQSIRLEVPDTELESKIKEMKEVIGDAVAKADFGEYSIEIKKVDMKKRDQDMRWSNILTLVGEDLMGKDEYKVTGIAYTVNPKPEIIIKTSVSSSDSDAAEYGKNMEKIIQDFLASEEMKEKVKDDPYIITIRSKDKKKLN